MFKQLLHVSFGFFALTLVTGCGGNGPGPVGPITLTSRPEAPLNVAANSGDGAISIGWNPPSSDGGAAIQTYSVELTPTVAVGNITISGTRALVRNLGNGTNYQVAVRATNSVGTGPASTAIFATPQAPSTAAYTSVSIVGDNSPSGIYDPSILRASNGDLWLAYSSVDYHNNAGSQLVQDVGIRLARSADGGMTFNHVATIASPSDTTVTDTDPSRSACGSTTCTGRWVYETSWLIEDSTDPNPNRRFKLFAHKYFLRPGGTATTLYHLGAIVMWTASSPDATWSAENAVLGWNLSPPEISPLRNVNTINTAIADCLVVAEGSATVRGSTIDFVFACPFGSGNPIPQKIILLRSTDHVSTFQYVATLLTASDATALGASHYTAPALIAAQDVAPILFVTPAFSGIYGGCVAFPIADDATGSVFRSNGNAVAISFTPPIQSHFGGACTYDSGLGSRGILQNDTAPPATPVATRFTIQATHKALRN